MNDLVAAIDAEIHKDIVLADGEDEQAHNERHWPERVNRQAEAFRRILARHQPKPGLWSGPVCATCTDRPEGTPKPHPCDEIKDLAFIYHIEVTDEDR